MTALDGLIRYVNPAYERITGFAAHEVMGKTRRVVQSGVHPPSFYRALWEALRGGQAHRAVFSNRARSGEIFHLEEELRPFTDRRGNTIGYVSIGRDISHQVRADEALRHRANYDSLTGVANRHLLMDTVQHEIARARRERGNFTVVCADLDGLKGINDHYGHATGDAALCAISKRLADTVREMDVVGRLGGDEFLLILPGMHRRGDIESSLRKLVDSVRSIEVGKDLPVAVTLSAGAATFPFDATDVEGLMRAADAAMYRAKLRGGNGFWVPGMDRAPRLRTRNGSVLAEVPRLCIAHLDEGNVRSDTLGARA